MRSTAECPFTMLRYPIEANGVIVGHFQSMQPLVPIRLINPSNGESVFLHALIDTGADESTFPGEVAELLGHMLKSKKAARKSLGTANGTGVAYQHTSTVKIYDLIKIIDKSKEIASIDETQKTEILKRDPDEIMPPFMTIENITVDFVEAKIPPIIGVKNCLDKCRVSIDYPKRTYSLHIV